MGQNCNGKCPEMLILRQKQVFFGRQATVYSERTIFIYREEKIMLDRDTIDLAKQADISTILQEFDWQMDRYNRIQCPHPDHHDTNPSCAYSAAGNTFKCFGCGEVFDTIALYQCLCEKVDGRIVPFYRAVEEILQLDGNTGRATTNQGTTTPQSSSNVYASSQSGSSSKTSPYDIIISNSKPITGYELNYLHGRGIFLYDSYVYDGQTYTVKNIDRALLSATDKGEISRLNEIKNKGTFYKATVPILHANRIQVRHNYWQGINSIVYHVDYDYDNDEALQTYSQYLETTECRHMAVQKTLDNQHVKRALGTSNFIWIAEKLSGRDIYICEGIEDGLSFAQNGLKSISLNSVANLKPFMQYLEEDYIPHYNEKFIIAFDHDGSGQKATGELVSFFEDFNRRNPKRKYHYGVCSYPQQFHDINDYWVSKVFQ